MPTTLTEWKRRVSIEPFDPLNITAFLTAYAVQFCSVWTLHATPPRFHPFIMGTIRSPLRLGHRNIFAFFNLGLMNPNHTAARPAIKTNPASVGSTLIGMIALNLFQ